MAKEDFRYIHFWYFFVYGFLLHGFFLECHFFLMMRTHAKIPFIKIKKIAIITSVPYHPLKERIKLPLTHLQLHSNFKII